MSMLAIVVNDELMMEYHRDIELDEHKQKYLASLDAKFDNGIELEGEALANPTLQQRAQFITLSLMEGIMYKEEKMASVSLAWLALRLPDLKQVIAQADHNGTKFELVFDKDYTPHVNVDFNPTLSKFKPN